MANVVGILFKQNTVIKQSTGSSDQLPSNQRQNVPVGTFLILQSYSDPPIDNHYKISLKNLQFKGYNTWYAYVPHVQVSQQPLRPTPTVAEVVSKQTEKNVAKIIVDKNTVPAQGSFLKIVFTIDTFIKREPVSDAKVLNENSKQLVPAGTELVLVTAKPDANNVVKFPIQDSHVKVTFRDIEFKGYNQDWYVFMSHAGIQRLG